jgi:hypothetical protein
MILSLVLIGFSLLVLSGVIYNQLRYLVVGVQLDAVFFGRWHSDRGRRRMEGPDSGHIAQWQAYDAYGRADTVVVARESG